MPLVKTTISYEHEEYGRQEASTFQREVNDLDVYDWMWYMVKASEAAGFDVAEIQITTSNGKVFRTEP